MYTICVYLFLDMEKQLRYCFVAKVFSIIVTVKSDPSFDPKFHFTTKKVSLMIAEARRSGSGGAIVTVCIDINEFIGLESSY